MGFSPSLDSAWHKHEIVLVRTNCSGVSGTLLIRMVLIIIAGELSDFNIFTACLEEPDI